MLVQRASVAENGAKNRSANGPLRVQSNGCGKIIDSFVYSEYSATLGCALIIRDMIVSC